MKNVHTRSSLDSSREPRVPEGVLTCKAARRDFSEGDLLSSVAKSQFAMGRIEKSRVELSHVLSVRPEAKSAADCLQILAAFSNIPEDVARIKRCGIFNNYTISEPFPQDAMGVLIGWVRECIGADARGRSDEWTLASHCVNDNCRALSAV
ncbi:unnamed protein product [Arctia plantaginis]|uniref:Uncharacterized protein n=1 Tax=Arctia plantaginis TaxID=874455 RepID=A0A8S0ZRT0_ARCPL|nr:unnamed protein product [Arctia plantaginis]CAB3251799.1 unnamed protein product [Arctia plantaginis]